MTGGGALAPGATFASDFEIVRPLSSGGMGSIYVAVQKSTGKQRALKLMLAQLVVDPSLRRRFEQEAKIASLIESDHVVEVVGAGVDEPSGLPWLAMELLEGTDLAHVVAQRGPMTLDETHRVFRQLCHAVSAAHVAGIVHRDLKPENIFLARSKSADGAPVVKVLDFGIAKIAVEAATKHTGAMGSPIWMAPEQSERGGVTTAADVWALGLIAFHLLTGRHFWRSANDADSTIQQIMREVLFSEIPSASSRARELRADGRLPIWFDGWFASCVVRDPAARFPDATRAFARFDRLCGGADAKTTDDAPLTGGLDATASPTRVVLTPPRSATPMAAPPTWAAATDASPTGPTIAMPDLSGSARFSTGEPERSARSTRWGFVAAGLVVLALAAGTAKWIHDATAPSDPSPMTSDAVTSPVTPLPPDLAKTKGAAWFARASARCNPVQVDMLLKQEPPPDGTDGAGFAAACLSLAGKIDRARTAIESLPASDRAQASWAVFEVVHPIADAGDDASAGPAMQLVLDYWPDNYMALYHAGMSEYRTGNNAPSKEHLARFLEIYHQQDGFTDTAKRVLREMDAPTSATPRCDAPIAIDPEGHKVYAPGCGATSE
ncbi:MAG TPA: serine/threonine-protein kinase [Polyangiaceae bacterium]|nr:serine/threonine-protein kinase [Polyangiaceae bacterium]